MVRVRCSVASTVPEDDFGQGLAPPCRVAGCPLAFHGHGVDPLKTNPFLTGHERCGGKEVWQRWWHQREGKQQEETEQRRRKNKEKRREKKTKYSQLSLEKSISITGGL